MAEDPVVELRKRVEFLEGQVQHKDGLLIVLEDQRNQALNQAAHARSLLSQRDAQIASLTQSNQSLGAEVERIRQEVADIRESLKTPAPA